MDQHYDTDAARTMLMQAAIGRADKNPKQLDLAEYGKDNGTTRRAYPVRIGRPRSWRLVTVPDNENEPEEVVLRLQGIICDRNLPPIRKPQLIALRERRYRRQSVMLTSFGADMTQEYIKAIQDIFQTFTQLLPANSLDPWIPSTFNGYGAIDMGNRFFTDRLNQDNHELVSFKSSVDPDGILEKAMGTDFVHLRENEVEYFECVDNGEHQTKYNVIDPNKISKGDIVEAQVSFAVVPIKNKRFKPLIILRAITLLDDRPSKNTAAIESSHARESKQTTISKRPKTLKRSIGYMEETEVASVQKKNRTIAMDIN